MFCPNCNYSCGENHRFCIRCGTDLHPEAGDIVIPAPKKGSHWVPVLILMLLSALGMLLFFTTRRPAPAVQSDTPWFSVHDGELYFDESLYTGGSELTVPGEISGEPVLYLSDGCFASCDEVTTVHLPDTLEYIGPYAFADCVSLRGLYIPDSVWYIGGYAFAGCTALEAISIPGGTEYIEAGAFEDCNKLFYIFYPGSIDDWTLLYSDFINPYTAVYCEDGSFYQGGSPFE